MTRWEARTALALAILGIIGALTWQFGPWGLLGTSITLLVVVLFVVDVRERDGEAVEEPARAGNRYPLR